jgi:hypothetical protein
MLLRMLQKAITGRKEITQVTRESVLSQSGGGITFPGLPVW